MDDYLYLGWLFDTDPLEVRAEVLMQDAIELMDEVADRFAGWDGPPISVTARRNACLGLCAEVFDRLNRRSSAA
jgi:hypothetical protein